MSKSSVAIGCDHAGLPLKGEIVAALREAGREVEDVGTFDESSVDYPDFAHRVSELVASGAHGLGVLVCGSGVGMSITANKHHGVRAVVCSEAYSATMARKHNDANVLCLGARVVGPGVARKIVEAFVSESFEGGRHARRVEKIELPRS